ncbi:hypothetical protein FQN53_000807 [Emmonsiellopsis sp. PD_33]|nr:hypothetical protein FQN53_000807 [Emmonsiellopsis sp. PD_33]
MPAVGGRLVGGGFTLIPKTVEKRKLFRFPVKPFLIAGIPSLSKVKQAKVKQVEEDFLEFVKNEDVQRYTRIGSFDEMDGEGRCRDSIIEIPTYQGATITSAATLLAEVVTHDKREEEIGILLYPVEDAEFHVKIWHIEAFVHNRTIRVTMYHRGENELEIKFKRICFKKAFGGAEGCRNHRLAN